MWFFKKRKEHHINKLKEEIHSNLKNSFKNIREDMHKITSLIHNKHDEQTNKILMLQRQIDQLEGKFISISNHVNLNKKGSLKIEEIELEEPKTDSVIQQLTNVQKSILLKLTLLSKENEKKWIPMKTIALDLYPDKDYTTIKSLVSNYTEILMTLGLVEKRRKGRETLVSLSKKGKNLVKNHKKEPIKKKIKIIS